MYARLLNVLVERMTLFAVYGTSSNKEEWIDAKQGLWKRFEASVVVVPIVTFRKTNDKFTLKPYETKNKQ